MAVTSPNLTHTAASKIGLRRSISSDIFKSLYFSTRISSVTLQFDHGLLSQCFVLVKYVQSLQRRSEASIVGRVHNYILSMKWSWSGYGVKHAVELFS